MKIILLFAVLVNIAFGAECTITQLDAYFQGCGAFTNQALCKTQSTCTWCSSVGTKSCDGSTDVPSTCTANCTTSSTGICFNNTVVMNSCTKTFNATSPVVVGKECTPAQVATFSQNRCPSISAASTVTFFSAFIVALLVAIF